MAVKWIPLGVGAFLLFDAANPGKAAAAPALKLEPRASVIYDSNIARSTKEAAEIRGLHLTDWRFSPGLTASAGMPLGNQSLFLTADAAYDFHARNKQLNRFRILLEGGARLQFSRCRGTLSGSFGRRQSELADLLDLQSVKNTETFKSVDFEALCGGPVGLMPKLGAGRTWSDNSNELRKISDSRSTSLRAGLAYARPSFGELAAVAEHRRVSYPNRLDLEGVTQGYDLTSLGATFERNLGARLRGKLGIHRTSVDSHDSGSSFSGLTANANLSYRLNDQMQMQFLAAREVRPATLGFGDFIVSSSYRLTSDYALTPRLSLNAGAGFESRRTEGVPLFPIEQLSSEKRYSGNGRITFKQSERVSIGLELRHELRRANPDLFDYSSTQGIANVRVSL